MNSRLFNLLLMGVGVVGVLFGIILIILLGILRDDSDAVTPTLVAVAGDVTATAAGGPTTTAASQATQTPTALPVPDTPIATTVVTDSTATLEPTTDPYIPHTVTLGETLTSIALSYGVSEQDIATVNNLANMDQIVEGQVLLIPIFPGDVGIIPTTAAQATAATGATATPDGTPTPITIVTDPGDGDDVPARPTAAPEWPPSLISGNLSGNYPLQQTTSSGNLLIHYQPGTYPADNIDLLAPLVDEIFTRLQTEMNGDLGPVVDVYLGGTLFGVNPSLQGFTQSYEFRTFILVNGAFHSGERNYILGHELTHVAATNILGPASSTMIHEGLAAHLPYHYLEDEAGYLPAQEVCAAAYQTDAFRSARELSLLAYGPTAFGGHIRTYFNYNLAGCFVGFLLENYTMDSLDAVYDSGDYSGVYGLSLGQLDDAWQARLAATTPSVDAQPFVDMVNDVAAAYETYINASAGGYHANYQAYLHLNQARLETNRGDLDAAQRSLDLYWSLLGF